MKTARTIPIAILSVVAVATFSLAGPFTHMFELRQELQWRTDLNLAHNEAVQSNLPMLIMIDADWCPHCEKMSDSTFSDTSLIKYINESFIPVHLPLKGNERVAEILDVERIPCSIALSPRADLLGRVVGCVNTVQYRETLAKVRVLQARVEHELAVPPK